MCKPRFEVYQLEHADVLITEVPRRPQPSHQLPSNIQASAKTIAAIKAADTQPAKDSDPWETDDPWGNYTPGKVPKRPTPDDLQTPDKIDVLAAKVQQKLQPAWIKHTGPKADHDQVMHHDDSRIQSVEDRMTQLEKTVQSNHAQQGKHVQELASKITQVQQNVDQQGRAFHAHLDEKLDQQLQQIEQLLSKRSRME